MKPLLYVEGVLLLSGWLFEIFMACYSVGFFSPDHQWSFSDAGIFFLALILGFPFVLLATFCWLLKRFVIVFLVGSILVVGVSIYCFYAAYFCQPIEGAEWLFMMIPTAQMFFVFVLSCVAFIAGQLIKPAK